MEEKEEKLNWCVKKAAKTMNKKKQIKKLTAYTLVKNKSAMRNFKQT